MRSLLFLSAAAFGLVKAGWESDVTVTVTATRTHSSCTLPTVTTTCENHVGLKPTGNAGDAWASKWEEEKSKNQNLWNDWATATVSKATTTGYTNSTSPTKCPAYTPVANSSDTCNSAADRSKWCNWKDLDSDVYANDYQTGVTRQFTFTIENITLQYDGTGPKLALAINGQVPGPVIEANWGDMVQVTVINNMPDNATSIHFHGVRQLGTNDQDGVPGVTECAIAGNGGSRTYTWLASSYGTSWYHSHAFSQYGDGIRGPIVIHGPATANYDLDMGTVMIDDTFTLPAATEASLITHYGPGGSFNTLFNGKNINPVGPGGAPFEWTVKPCRKHLFRIINSSVQNIYIVGFDSHNMTVIAADFVPIKPYVTDALHIGNGQRYDVIVEMDQPIGSYYVRAVIQTGCPSGGANSGLGLANAIINYEGSTTTPISNTPITNITAAGCADEPLASLVPWTGIPAGSKTQFAASAADVPAGAVTQVATNDDGTVFQWYINNGAISVNYSQPTLESLDNGLSPSLLTNPIVLSQANTWVYFIIENQFFASHPMHIHGHDVSVLGTGLGPWQSSMIDTLNFVNPIRRDTVMLTGSAGPGAPAGYTVIGFLTDNPGAWLMHCHIVWHVGDGLALQFIERPDDIIKAGYSKKDAYQQECAALAEYNAANPQSIKTSGESGLKKRTTYEKLSNIHAEAKRFLSHKRSHHHAY